MKKVFIAAVIGMVLGGCGGKDVSFDTLEQARGQARSNALWNAQKYRADTPPVKDADLVGRGDSTQSPSCPQGDGWATIDLYRGQSKIGELKCSTVSMEVGCMATADFKTKAYATEDGRCQPTSKVPFPLPKVGGK